MNHPFRVRVREQEQGPKGASDLAAALGRGPWLIVVPHDDDLVLGMALAVQAARHQGIDVHVAVATDGSLGYVRLAERAALVQTRAAELAAACALLGIAADNVHALGFRDGALIAEQGCRAPDQPDTLGQRLVTLLRAVRPSTLFVCTPEDVHPDHRAAAQETEIASVWASSEIWLERGAPCPEPARFHYAVYAPFQGLPEVQLEASAALFAQKLAALRAFASQGVIEPMIARLTQAGPFEYFQRARALSYRPDQYRALFRD